MIYQRVNYIYQNPVRASIVTHPHEYLFSSALDYAGERGYVDVQYKIWANRVKNAKQLTPRCKRGAVKVMIFWNYLSNQENILKK